MKKLKFMLAAATAIGLASATQADQYNTTGFEKLATNTVVTTGVEDNRTGYSYFYYAGSVAEDNESVIAEGTPNIARPRGAAAVDEGREKILQVSTGTDPLMRTYQGFTGSSPVAATTLAADTYVDTLVQFTVTPYTDTVTPGSADKLMVYLKESVVTNESGEITSASTNLVAVGGYYYGGTTAKEYVLDTDTVTVLPNTWHRLTVKAVLDLSGTEGLGYPGFQIWVDGVLCTLANGEVPYNSADSETVDLFASFQFAEQIDEGKYLLSLLAGEGGQAAKLQGVGFAGEGKVDDIVFGTVDPFATVFDFTFAFGTGVSAVTYTVGGTEYDQARTFPEVEAGTAVAITSVTYADDYMAGSTTAVNLSDPVEGVYTVTNAGASLTITPAEAYASVSGSKFGSFAEAISAAANGDTVTLLRDAAPDANITTAAATLDLNGKVLSAKTLTFTGDENKTLKGGEYTGSYGELVINNPANRNLTIDSMTFHASVKPSGSGNLLFFTNCTFKCDKTTAGADYTVGGTYHSYGIMTALADWSQVEVIDNYFYLSRRSAMEVCTSNDVYFCGNTVDGTVDPLTASERTEGRAFPALQIFKQGRVFIENNTFTGSFLGEAFALYNEKTNVSTSEPLVFNGNTVDNTVPYLWGFYESPDTPLPSVTNSPNLFFGANTIGANVDKTQGIYKALVQAHPEGCEYAENLALPTGYDTVYDWTHADGTTAYFVNDAFAADLGSVVSGDTIVAFPGADMTLSVVGLKLDADATYKNKWAVSQLTSPTTELEPGEKKEFSDEPTPAELAEITIVPSDAVSNALETAGVSIATYTAMFETVATYDETAGKWYAEVVPTAATTNTLQTQVNTGVGAVVGALNERSVSFTATPGFYYWVEYDTTLSANLANTTTRVLAEGNEVNIPLPSTSAPAQFYKVKADIVPAPLTGGGQD